MPAVAAVLSEGVGAPADVGAHEDLAVEVGLGQLLEGQLQHLEVIGGGVGAGVAGPQDGRPAARRSRRGSRAAGESRSRPCSCRRRPPSRSAAASRVASMSRMTVSGRAPASQARSRATARAARIASSRLGVDRLDHPVGGRLGGDRPEQRLLVAQDAEVGDAVAAVGDRDGRSRRTTPGSWAERRSRVGAIAADSAAVSPTRSASSTSR